MTFSAELDVRKTRGVILIVSGVLTFLLTLYVFILFQSRIPCALSSCPKTLVSSRKAVSFRDAPYFLDDTLNLRNPTLSFDIYGEDGMAILVAFNKAFRDNLAPHRRAELPSKPHYAVLLSFHNTLPTLLMEGPHIIQSSENTPFRKHRWNRVEILSSGRNILLYVNHKKILSFHNKKMFHGGIKILPVYKIPNIRNFDAYALNTEAHPVLTDVADTLYFILRLFLYLFAFQTTCYFLLYARRKAIPFSSYLKTSCFMFCLPYLTWSLKEAVQYAGDEYPLPALSVPAAPLFVLFFALHHKKFLPKRAVFLLTLFFFEGLSVALSPYAEPLRKPFYYFVNDKNHYWFFDPRVRLLNDYFNLNLPRHEARPYAKGNAPRIALFGSSSARGQFFPLPSEDVFSAQLEKKFKRGGNNAEVLNFAFEGSTSFTGLHFLKGIHPLFNPDIILWNYSGNDMLFMRGSLSQYDFLEKLYDEEKYVFHRLLYASYSVHAFLNFWDSTWVKALLYAPRRSQKQALYKANLEALIAFCKENHVMLVFVHETSERAVRSGYAPGTKRLRDRHDRWFAETFQSLSRKYNVPYVFTVPALHKRKNDNLYIDGVHYSKAGHDAMADILFEFLAKNKLFPRSGVRH